MFFHRPPFLSAGMLLFFSQVMPKETGQSRGAAPPLIAPQRLVLPYDAQRIVRQPFQWVDQARAIMGRACSCRARFG